MGGLVCHAVLAAANILSGDMSAGDMKP